MKSTWTSDLSCHIQIVDNQHQNIIQQFHQIGGEGIEKLESSAVNALLVKLQADITEHFKTEELLMKKYQLPGLDAHREIHQDYLSSLSSLITEYSADLESAVFFDQMNEQAEQFVEHIKDEDLAMGRTFYSSVSSDLNKKVDADFVDSHELLHKYSTKVQDIRWNDSFSTGLKNVDEQHQALIGRLTEYAEVMNGEEDWAKLIEMCHFLHQYVVEHFATEEALMEKYSFPLYQPHKKIHRNFIQVLKSVFQDFKSTKNHNELKQSINAILNWFVDHILTSDKKMGLYLVEARKQLEQKSQSKESESSNTGGVNWKLDIACYEKKMDEQHKDLLAHFANYSRALQLGEGKVDNTGMLKYLKQYIAKHFRMEEVFMENYGYSLTREHKAAHAEYVQSFQEMIENFKANQDESYLEFQISSMMDWFLDHISEYDKQLGFYLKNTAIQTLGFNTDSKIIHDAKYLVIYSDLAKESEELAKLLEVVGFEAIAIHESKESLMGFVNDQEVKMVFMLKDRMEDDFDLISRLKEEYSNLPLLLLPEETSVTALKAAVSELKVPIATHAIVKRPYKPSDLIRSLNKNIYPKNMGSVNIDLKHKLEPKAATVIKSGATGNEGETAQESGPISKLNCLQGAYADCLLCGHQKIPMWSLKLKSIETEFNFFDLPVYTKALTGFDFIDFNLLRITVCPECLYASIDTTGFKLQNLSVPSDIPFESLKDGWGELKQERTELAENRQNYNSDNLSVEQAVANYELAVKSLDTILSLNKEFAKSQKGVELAYKGVTLLLILAELELSLQLKDLVRKRLESAAERIDGLFEKLPMGKGLKAVFIQSVIHIILQQSDKLEESCRKLDEISAEKGADTSDAEDGIEYISKLNKLREKQDLYSLEQLTNFKYK